MSDDPTTTPEPAAPGEPVGARVLDAPPPAGAGSSPGSGPVAVDVTDAAIAIARAKASAAPGLAAGAAGAPAPAAGAEGGSGRAPRDTGRGRRVPAPPAHPAWRWGFPALLVALAVVTILASVWGADAVLHTKQGKLISSVTDPTKPGYRSQVTPTPTMLVVQTDDGGNLVDCVFVTLGAGDKGGTVFVLPPDLVVKSGDNAEFLWKVMKDRGLTGVEAAAGGMLGLGFEEVVTVTARSLAQFMEPVLPLTYSLKEPIVASTLAGGSQTLLRRGNVEVRTLAEVQAITEVISPAETTIPRAQRQAELWRTWLAAVQRKGGADAVGGGDLPLARYVRGLAGGTTTVQLVPYTEGSYGKAVLLLPDADQIAKIVDRVVPLPTGPLDAPRVLVELLNGTTDKAIETPARVAIVDSGGQLVVLGNAGSLDLEQSSVVFYRDDERDAAERIARALRIADVRLLRRDGEGAFDVTVTLGRDYRG